MATNKNQHFVPRCYFRPFTVDEANIAINIYNIDRQKFIQGAPVKNQCSGSYFYGKNEKLEKAIQFVEGAYGNVLREVRKHNRILTGEHQNILKKFWLLQYLRTEAAAIRVAEMTASVGKIVGITNIDFRTSIKNAVIDAMRTFAESMDLIDDLKICLIRNRTKIPFLTSDNPSILKNRWWFNDKRTQGRSFGIRSAGTIILLPISPRLLVLGYDHDVYSVLHVQGVVDIRNECDVAAFNQHQILNCHANLFFQNSELAYLVHEAFINSVKNRPSGFHVIHYAVPDYSDGEYTRYRVTDPSEREGHSEALLHIQHIHPKPLAWPKQIISKHKGVVFTNRTGLGYIRYATIQQSNKQPFYKEKAYIETK